MYSNLTGSSRSTPDQLQTHEVCTNTLETPDLKNYTNIDRNSRFLLSLELQASSYMKAKFRERMVQITDHINTHSTVCTATYLEKATKTDQTKRLLHVLHI